MGNENKKNPPQEENTQQGGYNPAEYETMREDLKQGQKEQTDALTKAHNAQIDGVAGLVKAAEEERKTSRANDAEYQKKANAFRYIAGIGDAISGVANLVGTAHGAVNQQQYYNAPAIIQKAEAERQQRKLAMDKLNARIDELTLRGDALRAGRDAELAKLSGEHSRQVLELNLKEMAARQAAKEAEDAANLQRELQAGRQAHEASESEKNREFQATEGDKKRAHDTAMQEGKNTAAVETARIRAEAAAKVAETNAAARKAAAEATAKAKSQDPKHQKEVLTKNIAGIRDELAKAMGYTGGYNEYMQYDQYKKVGDKSRRETRQFKESKAKTHPEIVSLLNSLGNPKNLTDAQIASLAAASSVFAEALKAAEIEAAAIELGNSGNVENGGDLWDDLLKTE